MGSTTGDPDAHGATLRVRGRLGLAFQAWSAGGSDGNVSR